MDQLVCIFDWAQSDIRRVLPAVCNVLTSICSRLTTTRAFFDSGALPVLLAVLNTPSRVTCWPAVVEVLAKIVAHQARLTSTFSLATRFLIHI